MSEIDTSTHRCVWTRHRHVTGRLPISSTPKKGNGSWLNLRGLLAAALSLPRRPLAGGGDGIGETLLWRGGRRRTRVSRKQEPHVPGQSAVRFCGFSVCSRGRLDTKDLRDGHTSSLSPSLFLNWFADFHSWSFFTCTSLIPVASTKEEGKIKFESWSQTRG